MRLIFPDSISVPAASLLRRAACGIGQLFVATFVALCMLAAPFSHAADGVEIVQAHLEKSEEGVKLSATFEFELHRGLVDALNRGVPLYFTTDVEITRKRWYWFDEETVTAARTVRISYNVLTRQYHSAVLGQLQQSFPTLEDALLTVRRPTRWVVAEPGTLKRGETYLVAVSMALDVTQLPKPFQVHALNSSDWRLSSDQETFLYKAE